MAISLITGTVASQTNYETNPATLTWDGTGSDVLVIVLNNDMNRTATEVTFNSVSATLIGDESSPLGTGKKTQIYLLLNPYQGSATLSVTLNSITSTSTKITAFGLSGVETSSLANSHRTVYEGPFEGASLTATATDSQNGDYVFAGVSGFGGPNADGSGQTSISATNDLYSGNSFFRTSGKSASGASTTLSWTATEGTYAAYVMTAMVPSSGSSAATALPRRALDGPFYGSLRGSVQ